MTAKPRWFQTTAIDYPNSRPHIGTAFEKVGADVQARYRRMEGYDVFFLMGNDENTLKVADKAKELGQEPQAYCDDMARQFREVWDALDISYGTPTGDKDTAFIQTSHERHKQCARKFIQKVYERSDEQGRPYIYKGSYEGWYCPGCEEFKSDKIHAENNGLCPIHKQPLVRRSEPCYYFRLSSFKDRLLAHLKENPGFVQPESRRNEMIGFIEAEGLDDLNISRHGKEWGIPLPFDEEFTTFVWFDALLTYITGIGYGDDETTFRNYWNSETTQLHFIGKDITRFHTHIWPAMLWAAGEEAPKRVFSHGFVTVDGTKMGKSMGNVVEPLAIVGKSSVDAYRYYFMRECPFPSDGDYSGQRYEDIYNSELANKLGNLLSRCITLITKNYDGILEGTANHPIPDRFGRIVSLSPTGPIPATGDIPITETNAAFVERVAEYVKSCQYHVALFAIVQEYVTAGNQFMEYHAPWKLVKTDPNKGKFVLFEVAHKLRIASILLKPFIPRSAEAIYTSFNFPTPWAEVKYSDAAELRAQPDDLRVTAELFDGKPRQLFPRIEDRKAG